MPRLAIVGGGSLGSLYAFHLSRAGIGVTLVEKNPLLREAVGERGLTLRVGEGEEHVAVETASPEEASCCYDAVLVTVKSYDTREAGRVSSRLVGEGGVVVTLQNGLGNKEALREAVGEDRVLQGVSTWGATLVSPGVVRLGGRGETFLEPPGSPGYNDSFVFLVSALDTAGLHPRVVDDILTVVWRKLLVNSVVNTLTALLRVRNGFLLESPATMRLARRVFEEAYLVGFLEGARFESAEEEWERLSAVVEATGSNLSSMLQDVMHCRMTEADAILGEVVRRGRARGLEMRYSSVMMELLRALEDRGRHGGCGEVGFT